MQRKKKNAVNTLSWLTLRYCLRCVDIITADWIQMINRMLKDYPCVQKSIHRHKSGKMPAAVGTIGYLCMLRWLSRNNNLCAGTMAG